MRILIFRPGRLGDFLVALPALHSVRMYFPNAEITLLTCASTQPDALRKTAAYSSNSHDLPWKILVHPSLVDRFVDFTHRQRLRDLVSLRADIAGRYDHIFSLPYSGETAPSGLKRRLFLRFCGASGPIARYQTRASQPQVDSALAPVRTVVDTQTIKAALGRRLSPSPADCERAETALRSRGFDGRRVIAVLASATYEHKRWPLVSFEAVLETLAADVDLRFILIGSAAERAQAETLATPRPNRTWNACGELEIGPLAGVLARCSLFLGNDSGPAHLAAAVGIPSVTLMSGIHPRGVWDPFAANATVLRHSVPCAPCHSEKACPLHTAACIREITPQRVSEACRAALA